MWINCHSYYSLRYGTLSPIGLVEEAVRAGVDTLALTDIDTTMGMVEFVQQSEKAGIKPVAGVQVSGGKYAGTVLLAKNREGLREINEYITACNMQKRKVGDLEFAFQDVYLIYKECYPDALKENEWIGIHPSCLSRKLVEQLPTHADKYCICPTVSFKDEEGFELHQYLRAVQKNTLLTKLKEEDIAHSMDCFGALADYKHLLDLLPELKERSERILQDCSIAFDMDRPKNKQVFTVSKDNDQALLEKLSWEGMREKYGIDNAVAKARVRKELDVIYKLGFAAYFLITWDMIRYSMSRGMYHVGRGSGANSVVAYCLKITQVDPIELDLYFERFLNPKRTSPPDFDIDYSWRDREEVQEYLFKRYGKEYTALLGTVQTFRGRSMFRELGKVCGLPLVEIEALVKDPLGNKGNNSINRKIWQLSLILKNFPNQRSIHAGGVLISEEPLSYYTALDLPPKGLQTTQWDMYVAEDLNYEKLDVLSQRGIGHILEATQLIKLNQGVEVDVFDMNTIKEDKKARELLRKGDAKGCFYIESPAMRGLLSKLKCDDYLTLVAASSIIRPGVAKSGMMRAYIERFHRPDSFEYLHPVMKEQLSETYGVMVFQEDVLKVCFHYAGLDLADADVLRRMMSGKGHNKTVFERLKNKFFENSLTLGRPPEVTEEVWRQIASFAGYSFSKAHSASYAAESFQSLYLKAYYPLEFMTAVINNYGGFYASWVYFMEAQRCGACLELPQVNYSKPATFLYDDHIYVGFNHINGFESKWGKYIVEERERGGVYRSLQDFMRRLPIGTEQIGLLIRSGAFRFEAKTRASLLWELYAFGKRNEKELVSPTLLEPEEQQFKLPDLEETPLTKAWDEMELLNFPLSLSFFDMLITSFRPFVVYENMRCHIGKVVKMMGVFVCVKYVKAKNGTLMCFATFLDHQGEFFDATIFPQALKAYPLSGPGVYLLQGKLVDDFSYPSMEVQKLARLPYQNDPRRV